MDNFYTFFRAFRFGVRQRVALTLLIGLLISLTVNSWLSIQEQARYTNEEINRNGLLVSKIISSSIANSVVGYDYHGIQLFIDEVTKSDIQYVKVSNAKGNTMAETEISNQQLSGLRFFNLDIDIDNNIVGHLTIGLNTDVIIATIEAQKESLLIREAGVIIFILLVELLALSILIIRPLSLISAALSQRTRIEGVLPSEIKLDSQDEFGDIARKFNALRAQLNNAHHALQGKIEVADKKLRQVNEKLLKNSQQLEETNRELVNQAVTDPLTGLFNRRKFQSLIKSSAESAEGENDNVSLLIADIDYFKKINDAHGHEVGDKALREFAIRLTEGIRKSDVICRIGGEEFAIFCYRAGSQDAYNIAEKLRQLVEKTTIRVGDIELKMTMSIGIATPGVGAALHCPDCLYRQADIALYSSKSTGRNRVTHFHEVDLDDVEDFNLEPDTDEQHHT
ncbi:diguanylate cyclase/phosphodiesterase (GGDEF & EAL domains) with PAS/PAC sensor(s) [hydrothermal vent metagenome]|uniref:Diguanylate cyclase/phosphodiesterase (GGDEF & EAL domains) with PAS/PAC sensor(S) n=1 Tax=hydrothermal vent metagenome TaxID=652676 RepID=A0A3B0ZY52_9ZZZZ